MTSTYFWSYFQSIFLLTISISAFDVKTTVKSSAPSKRLSLRSIVLKVQH